VDLVHCFSGSLLLRPLEKLLIDCISIHGADKSYLNYFHASLSFRSGTGTMNQGPSTPEGRCNQLQITNKQKSVVTLSVSHTARALTLIVSAKITRYKHRQQMMSYHLERHHRELHKHFDVEVDKYLRSLACRYRMGFQTQLATESHPGQTAHQLRTN